MSDGIPLLILAFATLGGVWFMAAAARKQVANAKGSPERYRFLASIAVAACMPAGLSQAQDQAEQALALLRASSAQSAIITFCGKHFAIDGTTALRISQTARDVATKVLGQERAEAAFKDELARRFDEVKAVGEQQWCADQRTALAGGEARIFRN